MRSGRERGGGPLGGRLLLVTLLPLIALATVGYQRIEREQQAVENARLTADRAMLQTAVAEVIGPAQVEQIALEGLAAMDELGLPRDVVVQIAGVDFDAVYDRNRIRFDGVLDDLAADSGRIVLPDGEQLATRLAFVRGALTEQRARSGEALARQADVTAVFEDLATLLDDALATADAAAGESDSGSSTTTRLRLDALRAVSLTGGNRGAALLAGLIERSQDNALGMITAAARHDEASDAYVAFLNDDERIVFDAVRRELNPIPSELLVDAGGTPTDESALDPARIQAAARSVLDQIDYLDRLQVYSSEAHGDVVVSLDAQVRAAESAVDRTQLLLASIVMATFALLVIVGWSVLVPIRRLTRRAESVSEGELAAEPLKLRGPSDVRTLARAMNDMLATLHAVDRQIGDLATGGLTPGSAAAPGAIGRSLQQSFEHLESMTAQLHASEQLASAIVEQAGDAIWTIDEHGLIRSANDASALMLGVTSDEQLGRPLREFLSTLDGIVTRQQPGGDKLHHVVTSTDIEGGPEPLTAVVAHDVSERLRFEERLAYQAHHDALTGLPNRFALLDHIEKAAPDERLALLFLDLDGFKAVNDVQGHLTGDQVLAEVARRLCDSMRTRDFVGRLGGDEFVIVMREFDHSQDVTAFARRLIREIEQPYGDDTGMFALSASVGVAVYNEGLASAQLSALDAIRQADAAVYHAKARGRGRVEVFDSHLQESIVHEADLEIALRSAVANDELEVHLQPVLDLRSHRFTRAEALVRWNRAGHGPVSPAEFIPVAERSSLILSIDRWVLRQSCELLASWHAADPSCNTRIAVNVSGRHLVDGNLLDDLHAAFAATGARPHMLDIELTETQLLDDLDRATIVLDAVRALGIGIAIDDFGTGYSSMAYLHRLPIDTLKIDRSFVATVGGDENDNTALLDALLTIGRALGVSIVAEGIETDEQLRFLEGRGCDYAQGFRLARPCPASEAEMLMSVGAHASASLPA